MQRGMQHFKGCHPDDDQAPESPEGHIPLDPEACWHCGTMADQGCYCLECYEYAQYIPPGFCYHCARCGRWWAYMTGPNVVSITIPDVD